MGPTTKISHWMGPRLFPWYKHTSSYQNPNKMGPTTKTYFSPQVPLNKIPGRSPSRGVIVYLRCALPLWLRPLQLGLPLSLSLPIKPRLQDGWTCPHCHNQMPTQAALTKHRPACEMMSMYKPLLAQISTGLAANGNGISPYWSSFLQMALAGQVCAPFFKTLFFKFQGRFFESLLSEFVWFCDTEW